MGAKPGDARPCTANRIEVSAVAAWRIERIAGQGWRLFATAAGRPGERREARS